MSLSPDATPEKLTVSEIAERVAKSSVFAEVSDRREVVLRRIRHWTTAGALPSEGDPHSGTGRHRTYSPQTIYLASVLNVLADTGLPLEMLKAASDAVQETISGALRPIGAPKIAPRSKRYRDIL